MTKDNIRI